MKLKLDDIKKLKNKFLIPDPPKTKKTKKTKVSKTLLCKHMMTYFKTMDKYSSDTDDIILIQATIRGLLARKRYKNYKIVAACTNKEDITTLDLLTSIKTGVFFLL